MYLVERLRVAFLPSLWIAIPYYSLQYVAIYPVTNVPRIFMDSWIAFEPHAVYPYLSMYAFIFLTGWLMPNRSSYQDWVKGLVLIATISHVIFFLWPNGLVRGVEASSVLHEMILQADQPRNAFPSLHASMTVFCAAMICRLRIPWLLPMLVWATLILWSTVALRQHVILDIAGGGLLGLAVSDRLSACSKEKVARRGNK